MKTNQKINKIFILVTYIFIFQAGCSSCGDNPSGTENSNIKPQGGSGGSNGGGGGQKSGAGGSGQASGGFSPGGSSPSGGVGGAGTSGTAGAGTGGTLLGDTPSQSTPEKIVSSYGCTWPGCADISRACDDYLRAGCGKTFSFQDSLPGLSPPSTKFNDARAACTRWGSFALKERLGEEEGDKDKEEGEAGELVAAAQIARCTRRATSCSDMLFCLRGGVISPNYSAYVPLPPAVPPPPPPVPPPFWEQPFEGGNDPFLDKTPWGAPPAMMPVDSPTCTSCAVQRCPDFAYLCFGALGNEQDCPGGDCCQGLRVCLAECGAYEPLVTMSHFDRCLHRCKQGRPKSVQQLTNLQHCGDVACKGCEQMDRRGESAP